MTSRQSSEGSDAIKAAKERLATANAWKKSAEAQKKSADAHKKSVEAQLKSAKEGVKSAETQLQDSKNEVKNAEVFLKQAYKKWEVIDVDDDEDGVAAASASGNKGKRKRDGAVSPDPGNEKKTRSNATAATSQTSASNCAPTGEVQEIVVEGAGTAEVNGTYKLCTSWVDALRCVGDADYPVFSRSGSWKGKARKCYIYRGKCGSCWYISGPAGTLSDFYYNQTEGSARLPSKNAWRPLYKSFGKPFGKPPAPQLKW